MMLIQHVNIMLSMLDRCYHNKVLLPFIQYDDNLINDNSEDIDVVMVLNRRKMIRVVIIACIEHYCINFIDVLSYCYH